MEHSTFAYEFRDLDVDLSQIQHVLGYGEGDDHAIVEAVLAQILSGQDLFKGIRTEYKIFDDPVFNPTDKSVSLGYVHFQTNRILFNQLKGSDSIAVFLCTAGEEVGARIKASMAEGDPVTGYICDMLGTLVVDAAADRMQLELEQRVLRAGKRITNRYSPGYCGWEVAEQHKLFSLMENNFCGIRLTDSALMDPIKSISGFIGIGRKVKYNEYTCSLCDMKNCAYREVPAKVK